MSGTLRRGGALCWEVDREVFSVWEARSIRKANKTWSLYRFSFLHGISGYLDELDLIYWFIDSYYMNLSSTRLRGRVEIQPSVLRLLLIFKRWNLSRSIRRKRISLVKALQMLPQDVTEKWNICVTDFSLQYVKLTFYDIGCQNIKFPEIYYIDVFIKSLINQFILFSSPPICYHSPLINLVAEMI